MRIALCALAFAIAIASLSFAAGEDRTAHCAWGTGALLLGDIRPGHEEQLFQRCQPGDTIGIRPDYTVIVARVCDFAQPVMVLRTKVVCVLRPPRGVRASD
jgi:hypothetical protein